MQTRPQRITELKAIPHTLRAVVSSGLQDGAGSGPVEEGAHARAAVQEARNLEGHRHTWGSKPRAAAVHSSRRQGASRGKRSEAREGT